MTEPTPALLRRPAPSREEMKAAFKRSSPSQTSKATRAPREIPTGLARARRGAASPEPAQPSREEPSALADAPVEPAAAAPRAHASEAALEALVEQAPEAVPLQPTDPATGPEPTSSVQTLTDSAGQAEAAPGAGTCQSAPGEGQDADAEALAAAASSVAGSAVTAPAQPSAPVRTAQGRSDKKVAPRRAAPARAATAAKAAAGPAGAHRTVSKLLVSTHELLTSARKATGRTNTALALLAIDHQAAHLPRLLQQSRSLRSGSLFKDLPGEVERRVRVTLDFTPAQVEVIDDLARQHGTNRQQLIDVAVAAEYGTAKG